MCSFFIVFVYSSQTFQNPLSEYLRLHRNSFTGEFPEEICDLISGGGDLIQIYADCKNDYGGLPEVNCTCCTDCCNPGDQGSCESIG